MRLKWYLVLLVLATLCPLLTFTGVLAYRHGLAHRTAVEQGLLETARVLSIALDEHFDAGITGLRALATSEHLDTRDLRAFYDEAGRVRAIRQEWLTISLFDRDGQRLLYTLAPFGTRLPPPPPEMAEPFKRLVSTQRPAVSNLFPSPIRGRPTFSIGVPAVRDGEVRYVLSAGVDGDVLGRMIARQRVPPHWTLVILDRQHVIAAGSRSGEPIGQTAAPSFVARVRTGTEGTFRDVTKDGLAVYAAFARSPVHGWTVSVGVSAATVDAATMGPVKILVGVGAVLLLAGALLAIWVGRRVTRPIESIVVEADRLGRGETPQPVRSVIREVAELSANLAAAGGTRARADEEIRMRVRQQSALADFGQRALAGGDLDALLDAALQVVATTLGADAAGVMELLPNGSALRFRAGVGWKSSPIGAIVAAGRDSLSGFTLLSRGPLVVADVRQDTRFTSQPLLHDHGIAGALTAVIGDVDAPWGVLGAFTARPRAFAQDDVAFLQGMANVLASLVQRARAQEDLQATQAQLLQAQKMEAVGQLAGGIAHDFNNLLTVIGGRARILAAAVGDDARLRRNVELIVETSDRAATLTQQLLAFSRRQVLQPRVIDLNAVVSEMDTLLRRLIGEHIELLTHLMPDLGPVRADPGQIAQIIMNLTVNARDAMPEGGRLVLETANAELDESYIRNHTGVSPGRFVMLAVTDTGTGMDEAVRIRIFEPFFTTKEKGRGTGLGLATVYGTVHQSGGHIWVYSEPGHGTSFKIYLPRVDEAPASPAAHADSVRRLRGTETVLVVEDDADVRELACDILAGQGYEVLAASTPAEALRIMEGHAGPIDLVLTDVVMPGMSGVALAQRLAALRRQVHVLYMSGYTDEAIVQHGALGPGTPFIQKPFVPNDLLAAVRDQLENSGPEGY